MSPLQATVKELLQELPDMKNFTVELRVIDKSEKEDRYMRVFFVADNNTIKHYKDACDYEWSAAIAEFQSLLAA